MTDTDKKQAFNQTTLRGVIVDIEPATKRGKYDVVKLTLKIGARGTRDNVIPCEFFGRDCKLAAGLGVGDEIIAEADIGGHAYNGRVYADAFGLLSVDVTAQNRTAPADAFDAAPELPDRDDAPQGRAAPKHGETALINAEFDAATEGGDDELPF